MIPVAFMISAGLTAASGAYSAYSQGKAASGQREWDEYNAIMSYNNAIANTTASLEIASLNADQAIKAAAISTQAGAAADAFNMSMIHATTQYAAKLYDEELVALWEAVDLDILNIEKQRAVERGEILAGQAASGTVMGEGSNADVVIAQKTQEEMDILVVKTGANRQAASIQNAKAKALWEGAMQIQKIQYEGFLRNSVISQNAALEAQGLLKTATIQGLAEVSSAEQGMSANMTGAKMRYNQNQNAAMNSLVSGMFGAGQTLVKGHYAGSTPGANKPGSSLLN